MSYATQQDLVTRFGELEMIQLTDRNGAGEIDAGVVAKALLDAGKLIDSYIAARAALPLPSVPDRLVRVAGDIARYYLHADRPTEQVAKAYEDAVRWLRDIAAGKATLEIDGASVAPPADLTISIQTGGRIFGRDALKGF